MTKPSSVGGVSAAVEAIRQALVPKIRSLVEAVQMRETVSERTSAVAVPPPAVVRAVIRPKVEGAFPGRIDLLAIGKHVEPENAQPGDFIQYWKKNESGAWRGHAAIISRVWKDSGGNMRAEIMGAHEPQPDTRDFICRKDFDGVGLNLQEPGRLVYIVRMKPR